MLTKKIDKDSLQTTAVRILILLLNFAIVVLTTQYWGKEGRGIIAIFAADLSLIATITNILTNSSVSFFFKKIGHSPLATLAFIWVFVVTSIAAIIVFFVGNNNEIFAISLFVVSIFLGCITFYSSLYLGVQKIVYYNVATLLMSLLQIVFLVVFALLFPQIGYFSYFFSQILAYAIVLFVCAFLGRKLFGRIKLEFRFAVLKKCFAFGWQEELSAFVQFLNTRLCFYLIGIYSSISAVGIFSIGVTLSEAILVFARSMSLVNYSRVLKIGNTIEAWGETRKVAIIAIVCTVVCLVVACILPSSLYEFIFGEGFRKAKMVIILLSLGIISRTGTNIFFSYYSGLGQLKKLIIMSLAGLVVTLSLAFWLIPSNDIEGACIVNTCSYLMSFVILLIFFYRSKKQLVK